MSHVFSGWGLRIRRRVVVASRTVINVKLSIQHLQDVSISLYNDTEEFMLYGETSWQLIFTRY